MNYKYVVNGAKEIGGEIVISGNKNSALPCIAATILTKEDVILENIPEIEDVFTMFRIMLSLGSNIKRLSQGRFLIQNKDITSSVLPDNEVKKIRASILLIPPLLLRKKHVITYPPGGDVIGRRRLDTHFLALSSLGVDIKTDSHFEFILKNHISDYDLFLDEPSVTGTENAIMLSVIGKGVVNIENAACEPHVQDLCIMLNKMGANIQGIGTNVLKITGVEQLSSCQHSICPDNIEIGSFIGLSVMCNGELTLKNVDRKHLKMLDVVFAKLGVNLEYRDDEIYIAKNQSLKITDDFGNMMTKIEDAPYPGFPADLMPIAVTVATKCNGSILLHEKMFESRMFFTDKLVSMGANIVLCDPHRVIVTGPRDLCGTKLTSPDIRAGMSLLVASISAFGISTIDNVYQIERGYQQITERLKKIGVDIEKVFVK